jgi:hypothetical protein
MSEQPVHGSPVAIGEKTAVPRSRSFWRRLGLVLLAMSAVFLIGASSASSASQTIPTITITNVVPDQNVSIQTFNYPANQTFTVRMNYYGTLGINGEVVGTLNSGAGGSLTGNYNIPNFLKGQQRIAIRLDSPQGYFSYNWFWNNTSGTGGQPPPTTQPPGYSGIPTFSIVSVRTDVDVTIQTNNFPPNQLFDVTMGLMFTQGINGIKVGEIASGAGGSFQATFPIPAELRGQARIAIRAQTRQANPFYAYNWFWNNSGGTGGQPPPTQPPTTGVTTIRICQVVRDGTVEFQTANYPANMNFTVTMGPMGTQGIGGATAGTFNSGAGGSFRVTMPIPAAVFGLNQIAIRAQGSPNFSYNWFWNTTTTASFCQ